MALDVQQVHADAVPMRDAGRLGCVEGGDLYRPRGRLVITALWNWCARVGRFDVAARGEFEVLSASARGPSAVCRPSRLH